MKASGELGETGDRETEDFASPQPDVLFRAEKRAQVSTVSVWPVEKAPVDSEAGRLLLVAMRTAWVETRAETRVWYQRPSRCEEMKKENFEIAVHRT